MADASPPYCGVMHGKPPATQAQPTAWCYLYRPRRRTRTSSPAPCGLQRRRTREHTRPPSANYAPGNTDNAGGPTEDCGRWGGCGRGGVLLITSRFDALARIGRSSLHYLIGNDRSRQSPTGRQLLPRPARRFFRQQLGERHSTTYSSVATLRHLSCATAAGCFVGGSACNPGRTRLGTHWWAAASALAQPTDGNRPHAFRRLLAGLRKATASRRAR